MYIKLDEAVENHAERLPLTEAEQAILVTYLKDGEKKGLDIEPAPIMKGDFLEWLREGAVCLRSLALDRRFLFVKENAGKGLFGRQKKSFVVYLGDVHMDEYMQGSKFGNLAVALTSINNIYREVGLL